MQDVGEAQRRAAYPYCVAHQQEARSALAKVRKYCKAVNRCPNIGDPLRSTTSTAARFVRNHDHHKIFLWRFPSRAYAYHPSFVSSCSSLVVLSSCAGKVVRPAQINEFACLSPPRSSSLMTGDELQQTLSCGCVASIIHFIVPLSGNPSVVPSSYLTAHGSLVPWSRRAIVLVAGTPYTHHATTSPGFWCGVACIGPPKLDWRECTGHSHVGKSITKARGYFWRVHHIPHRLGRRTSHWHFFSHSTPCFVKLLTNVTTDEHDSSDVPHMLSEISRLFSEDYHTIHTKCSISDKYLYYASNIFREK